jgi:hypothetical protein
MHLNSGENSFLFRPHHPSCEVKTSVKRTIKSVRPNLVNSSSHHYTKDYLFCTFDNVRLLSLFQTSLYIQNIYLIIEVCNNLECLRQPEPQYMTSPINPANMIKFWSLHNTERECLLLFWYKLYIFWYSQLFIKLCRRQPEPILQTW